MTLFSAFFLLQISERIYDNSTNHGDGDRFDYVVKGLSSSTSYKLGIAAVNKKGKVVFSKSTVEFTTDCKLNRNQSVEK